ncbi:hypothetical protein [Deinococcus peraridilitoris]|uniref:Uncharacterized protein n=1 Tax=Deinococcus peraridilitoris (strain DSM 19664 / LMG 22246 / CIP 109416 / KR-200) TaxID=937777 RepID=K9ZVT2_DEIPD|nr:hypothetical protein [Deinococcus peraridilitoris]AFZ65636.1 hypothetical protein Deipe_0026 [Deinococcus peraridilitoris DSM 19664]
MSDEHQRLEESEPLGKSVEDVERDSQNRVNPSVPLERFQDGGGPVAAVPPVNATGSWPGTTGVGATPPEVPIGPPVRSSEDDEKTR